MQTITGKIRSITLANVHTVLDFIKSLNSIGEYQQYIRDLETARDILDDQAAISRAKVNTLPAEIARLQAQHDEADRNIDILLSDDDTSNDHLAKPLEAKLLNLETQISSKESQLATAQEEFAKFEKAVSEIDMTLISAKGKLQVLQELESTTGARQKAEKLLSGVSVGEAPDTDSMEQKLRDKAAVANNGLDRSIDRLTSSVSGGSTFASEIEARQAARRAKIAANKKGESQLAESPAS